MKILSILIASFFIGPIAQAESGRLLSLTLDGKSKPVRLSEIKEILVSQSHRIDIIELKNGEIFYDTDIRGATILLENNYYKILKASKAILLGKESLGSVRVVGGDGSGGG